ATQRLYRGRLYLAHWSGITSQLRIAGEQRDPLGKSLRQQDAIEGIFVQVRQALDVHGMLAGNRQLHVAIVEQATAEQTRLDTEVVATEGALDGDLPQACGAEEQVVLRVAELPARRGGEPLRLTGRPEKNLSIEQEFHTVIPNRAAISLSP